MAFSLRRGDVMPAWRAGAAVRCPRVTRGKGVPSHAQWSAPFRFHRQAVLVVVVVVLRHLLWIALFAIPAVVLWWRRRQPPAARIAVILSRI